MPHTKRPVVVIDGKVLGTNNFARGGFVAAPAPRRPEDPEVVLKRCIRLIEMGHVDAGEALFESLPYVR